MSKVFVGIDVSKDFSTAQGVDKNGKKLFYLRFAMNAGGFSELLKAMIKFTEHVTEITAAMESTGCYHINLFSFLSSEGVSCVVVNPLLITNFARLSLRKTKTDKKDAQTIAQFLLANEKSLSAIAFSQDTQDIKDLSRERESMTVLISGMKNDIKRLLQGTFPELEKLCSPYGETMLHFLKRFPSARLVRAAKQRDIEKALICPDEKRKRVMVSAEDIIAAAKTSVASSGAAKELILSEKISTLLYLQKKNERITEVLIKTCESLMIEELDIIRSIDGVNDITGSTFLAEIGDINKFTSYKHIIAFAGLDPSIHQSGQYVGRSTISKRGNRHLRRIIFLMTLCAVRCKNAFREYFLRRKQEGLPPKKAILATSHKLIRVIFAMLSNKTLFRKGVAVE
ncbi:MAG: IS110 family transposase [Thermodesulfovibrionales bacterium]